MLRVIYSHTCTLYSCFKVILYDTNLVVIDNIFTKGQCQKVKIALYCILERKRHNLHTCVQSLPHGKQCRGTKLISR